jgi:hypothetical protein
MTASFIRVLILERMLYENETAYVDALERTWTSWIALWGFLLEGSTRLAEFKKLRPSKQRWGRVTADWRRKQPDWVAFRVWVQIRDGILSRAARQVKHTV